MHGCAVPKVPIVCPIPNLVQIGHVLHGILGAAASKQEIVL